MLPITTIPILLLILHCFFTVPAYASVTTAPSSKYVIYLSIDAVLWDYYPIHASDRSRNSGPHGDFCTNAPFSPAQLIFVGNGTSWDSITPTSVYPKLRFRQYTDITFTKRVRRPVNEKHLALLGPLLRLHTHDTLVIYLRGVSPNVPGASAYGIQIDSLSVTGSTRSVQPGQIARFQYFIPSHVQSKGFVSSRLLLYRGVVDGTVDGGKGASRGLIGPLIVYPPDSLNAHRLPKHIHTEIVTVLTIFNENLPDESGDDPHELEEESNLMHTINGRLFCSLRNLHLTVGRYTRWYFANVGNEVSNPQFYSAPDPFFLLFFFNVHTTFAI